MAKTKLLTQKLIGLKKRLLPAWKKSSKLTKVMVTVAACTLATIGLMYTVATWYRLKHNDQPMQWGISWSFKYAHELGVDPREGLEAVLTELPISRVRLMSYWDMHEPQNNQYDWAELDWQIATAEKYGTNVTLSLGLRQPRWPECHMPSWAQAMPYNQWKQELNDYIKAVVARYDKSLAIVEYQLENEFLLKAFGECPDHSRERLVDEFNKLKQLTNKPIIVSRSNNATPSWPIGAPRADVVGASIYKRIYEGNVTKNYFEYGYPAWFYGFLAGATELTTGKETIIHELQAEPFGPSATVNLSDKEQSETMNARRLKQRLNFAHNSGIRTIDIWGAEWYYWRKTTRNDDSLWQTIQTELPKHN